MRAISPITKISPFFITSIKKQINGDFPVSNELYSNFHCECEASAAKDVKIHDSYQNHMSQHLSLSLHYPFPSHPGVQSPLFGLLICYLSPHHSSYSHSCRIIDCQGRQYLMSSLLVLASAVYSPRWKRCSLVSGTYWIRRIKGEMKLISRFHRLHRVEPSQSEYRIRV